MSEMATPLNIVVGVTGGIAAYKAVGLIREFVLAGHDVQVIATEAALRFVGAPTLEAISRNPLARDLYDGVAEVRHVAIARDADLVVIAPATANTIAKLAAGIADDLLGNTVLATAAPVVIAPAMHTEMWQHEATRHNVAVLGERGVHVVGPVSGRLTGDDVGAGRMAEPEEIAAAALRVVHADAVTRDLDGVRVVVTAGGTREPLDPVRYLGNRSSGRQGIAIAEAAAGRGAEVTLLAAHLEVPPPQGIRVVSVSTARELQSALARAAHDADLVVMAAAVADYRPLAVSETKIKKKGGTGHVSLDLAENPDIVAELCADKPDSLTVVAFAAETEDDKPALLKLARAKLAKKGAEYLVVNTVGWSEGFGSTENTVTILSAAGDIVRETTGSKADVADSILDVFAARH